LVLRLLFIVKTKRTGTGIGSLVEPDLSADSRKAPPQ